MKVATIVTVACLFCLGGIAAAEERAVLMGMKLDGIEQQQGKISVTATGAEFILGADGRIDCFQRIPLRREVARLHLPADDQPAAVQERNDFSCTLSTAAARLTLQGDSLLIIRAKKDFTLKISGLFRPVYRAEKDGRWMFIDQLGGFGIYPAEKHQTAAPDFSHRDWDVEYQLCNGEEVWLSVFPPRPYNWRRAYGDLIAHEGNHGPLRYPSRELIDSSARHCNVLVVHSWFWPGGDRAPWMIPRFVPDDMQRFIRLREDARAAGMKFIPYYSPLYYSGRDFYAEIRRALDEYKVDGLYFDGGPKDFRESYKIIRRTRQMLGNDRLLFRHCTTDPLDSNRVYCPFIDAYCDYIYRGEAGRAGLPLDDFLRWTISGYNISNAVGYWVYTGSTGKPGYVRQAPAPADIDAAIRNEVRLPRTEIGYEEGLAWELGDGHIEEFDRLYYDGLEVLRSKIESAAARKELIEYPGTSAGFFSDK